MKILIVKTSSMGDVVHPADDHRHRRAPAGAVIDWVVENRSHHCPAMRRRCERHFPIAWRKWRKSLWKTDTRSHRRGAPCAPEERALRSGARSAGLVKVRLWAVQANGPLAQATTVPAPVNHWLRCSPAHSERAESTARCAALHVASQRRIWVTVSAIRRHALRSLHRQGMAAAASRYAVLITGASRPRSSPEASWLAVAARLRDAGYGLVWLWAAERTESAASAWRYRRAAKCHHFYRR